MNPEVLVVGLTGGIGSGKSTVAALLAERGAVVIDADRIARDVVEPGRPAHGDVVRRFGPAVLAADGTIDRPALASIVFADPAALADLNALTHPAIGEEVARRLDELAGTAEVVVLDVPLLVETDRARSRCAAVVVVDCPDDVAVRRLVEQRGMAEADVRARRAAQVSREERLAMADFVVDNSDGPDQLAAQVDRCWAWIRGRRAAV